MSIWIGGGVGRIRIEEKKKMRFASLLGEEYPLPPLYLYLST